jgi:hypothetical protein
MTIWPARRSWWWRSQPAASRTTCTTSCGSIAATGVQEYLVLVAYERQVRWFNWQVGEDREIMPDDDGILRSLLFSGLWLDPVRFWEGDVAGLLALLQQGLAEAGEPGR